MAEPPRSRSRARDERSSRGWIALGAAAILGASLASMGASACIDFDGLDSAEADGGGAIPTQDTSVGPAGDSATCGADLKTDPFNCGACNHSCPIRLNSIPTCTDGACGLTCNGNFGNCDKTDDNGCETELLSDSKNCGACAHDCGGAACATNQCAPITLSTNQSYPQQLAVAATTVYWVALYSFTVDSIAIDGGATTPIATNEIYPSGVALDTANIYWVDRGFGSGDGLVRRLPLTGGAVTPTTMVAGLSTRPNALAIAGADLYYVTLGISGTDGTVVRVPTTNVADAGAGIVIAAGQSSPQFVLVDTTSVYWTNAGTNVLPDAGGQNGTVMKCTLPACPGGPQIVAGGQNHPHGIAQDATSIYWTNFGLGQNDGAILKAPKSGVAAGGDAAAGAVVLASGLLYPDAVAVDTKYVYFTTRAGLLQRVPIGGGAPETMVTVLQSYPLALAVDDTFLYFATPSGPSGGSIMKVAK